MKLRFRPHALLFASLGLLPGLLTSAPAAAQEAELRPLSPPAEHAPAKTGTSSDMEIMHVTDRLTNSPEGQQALRNYMAAREAGLLPAGKRSESYAINDEKSFNVLDGIQADEPSWKALTFVLRSANDVANVWIDKTLDDSFSEENLTELDEHMLNSTPPSSFRPDRGIIENDNYLFGAPPDYDKDGKVDILLYDIEEGKEGSCCVLGYVTSTDINPQAPQGSGNQADVLYVDLPDGIRGGVSGIAWIVAHEYQHLIHYAYQNPPGSELTFVNEGLSEWASYVNGYFHRRIRYLTDQAEHSTPLLDWNTSENVFDYERAGLFTSYIAQQIGAEATGSIVQARMPGDFGGSYAIGEKGYEVILEEHGSSLSSVIAGFHTANFINDTAVDPLTGYDVRQRTGITMSPTTKIDGTSRNQYTRFDFPVNPGAVQYFTWTEVANMSLQADIYSAIAEQLRVGQRKRIELRAFMEHVDGRRTIETITPGDDSYGFPGDFSSFTLIVVNTAPYASTPLRLDVNSSWDDAGSSGVERQTVSYDDGKVDTLFFALEKEAILANKFPVPKNGRLTEAHVAPVYDNQFSNSEAPDGATRDFQLRVWRVDPDGFPGDEIFSLDVTESPTTSHLNLASGEFSFLEISLPDTSALSELGDSVFVGMANLGSDINYLALVPSRNANAGDVSYLYLNFSNGAGWAPFGGITVGGEPVLEEFVNPIRVEFVVSTSTDSADPLELPEQVSLSQNYPNPFNPATSITFSLPKSTQVRLAVYDALGRHVATVVDGVRSAGDHSVQLDAGGWASGVYFYTLETDAQTISKHMVLMK